MLKKFISLILGLLFLYSCVDKSTKPETAPSFFGKILNNQQELLNRENPKVVKVNTFNGVSDSSVNNSIKWEQELGVFRKLDIFKMSGKSVFSKKDGNYCYKYLEISTKGIDSLFVYGPILTNPDSIIAFGSAKNFFFDSKSVYSLNFDTVTSHLKRYSLVSEKVFVWGKTNSFSMFATIEN